VNGSARNNSKENGNKASSFTRFANGTARASGRPAAFITAITIIILWAVSGPVFGFSDTWQLVVNTGTTIITFLMVFLIQNTQNRDTVAIQIKLDELIRSVSKARNRLINVEDLDESELQAMRDHMIKFAQGRETEESDSEPLNTQ
jgi:low affinity Fe/Cu permease